MTGRNFVMIAATLVVQACGGGSSPSAPGPTPTAPTPAANRAPVISSMTIAPAFGIAQLTQYTFNSAAADPDGDTLTYLWDFAGTPFSGTSGTMVFPDAASGDARLTVSDGKGASGTDTRTFVVGSMTGNWSGVVDTTFCTGVTKPMTASLVQTLTAVTGTIVLPNGLCSFNGGTARTDPAEAGRIDVNGSVTIRIKVPPFTDVTFRGAMDSSGRRLSGGLFGSGHNGTPVVLTKQ